jgi:hypothetical protein
VRVCLLRLCLCWCDWSGFCLFLRSLRLAILLSVALSLRFFGFFVVRVSLFLAGFFGEVFSCATHCLLFHVLLERLPLLRLSSPLFPCRNIFFWGLFYSYLVLLYFSLPLILTCSSAVPCCFLLARLSFLCFELITLTLLPPEGWR